MGGEKCFTRNQSMPGVEGTPIVSASDRAPRGAGLAREPRGEATAASTSAARPSSRDECHPRVSAAGHAGRDTLTVDSLKPLPRLRNGQAVLEPTGFNLSFSLALSDLLTSTEPGKRSSPPLLSVKSKRYREISQEDIAATGAFSFLFFFFLWWGLQATAELFRCLEILSGNMYT